MYKKWVVWFLSVTGFFITLDAAAALTPFAQREIDHLLGFVEISGCEFLRNGAWYSSERALAHLRSKYAFVKNSINATEDFIEKAASRSSMTRQPYQVRCGPGAIVPADRWLTEELMRFRAMTRQSD